MKALGAATIVPRAELAVEKPKPLTSERWNYAIDTVGGAVLANVLTGLRYGTAVAACGNAGGNELGTTVLPFILRGVDLIGVDSVMRPFADRQAAWDRLVRDLPMDKLDAMTGVAGLRDLPELAGKILKGQVRGRTVIDLSRRRAKEDEMTRLMLLFGSALLLMSCTVDPQSRYYPTESQT